MKVDIIKGHELTDDMKSHWDSIQQSNSKLASPFFCHEFINIVSKCRNDIYIAVISDENNVIGFFAFQKGKLGVAKPVAGAMSDYHGLIADVNIKLNMSEILDKSNLSRWSFDHLISSQDSLFTNELEHFESPIIDVSNGYDNYLCDIKAAKSKFISQTQRKKRKLERDYGPVKIIMHSTDLNDLKVCLQGKEQQFKQSGLPNPFTNRWIVNMLEMIHKYQSDTFSGILSVLYLDEKPIATHMGMKSKDVWHYWLPTYDHTYSNVSPGQILLLEMIQYANDNGISYIDLGKGESTYKNRVKNNSITISEGVCFAEGKGKHINKLSKTYNQYENWLSESTERNKLLHLPRRIIQRIKRDGRYN